ncbi:MAG: hypothetical protein GY772_17820 [bacterium]|nr:hypothetical protein [bacterium]
MEFFRRSGNGSIVGLVPSEIDNREDLFQVIETIDAEAKRAKEEFQAQCFDRLQFELVDPSVRELVAEAQALKIQCEDQRRKLAALAEDLKKAQTGQLDARRELALALDTVALQAKLVEAQNDTTAKLKFEVARLRALEPSPDPVVEVLPAPSPFFVGQPAVVQPDNRSTLEKMVDGYVQAWRSHTGWMSFAHLAALAIATQRSENRALQMDLEDSIDDHEEAMVGLWTAQDQNEALAEEVEVKARALKKAEAEREAMESRPTTEVHINEAPGFTDGQIETLGARLEGRVDRSVQSEMRTNSAKYRGARGDRGTAGKQGRDGRDGKSTHTTNDVHHHHHPVIKSTTKPVEVRRVVQTLQPRTPPGGQTEGTRRLIESMNRLKRTDK